MIRGESRRPVVLDAVLALELAVGGATYAVIQPAHCLKSGQIRDTLQIALCIVHKTHIHDAENGDQDAHDQCKLNKDAALLAPGVWA